MSESAAALVAGGPLPTTPEQLLNSTQAMLMQAQLRADKLLEQNTELVDKVAERDALIDALRQKLAIFEELVRGQS